MYTYIYNMYLNVTYIFVCIHTYICVQHIHIHTYIYMYICACSHLIYNMYINVTYIYVCIHTYICILHIHIHKYIQMYICTCSHLTHIYIYIILIHTDIFMYTSTPPAYLWSPPRGVIVVSIVSTKGEVCIAYTSVLVNLWDPRHILGYL